ncbi:hypothetical protein Q9L42_014560 [Methylomarinum sp. Ch1-1]|uniref:Uncharacterized protein n=1 Tax=Methylomarinum roseum TaxID=3067653 RepID=A0AAU7NRI1_9GAMM
MAIVHIQADCLAANPPGCDANVKPIVLKRIETWCASYRQHTLPVPVRADQAQRIRQQRRAASRSKPPKTAPREKLAIVHIQADCLAANPPGCDANVKPIVLKRSETWCASFRQHTLPVPVGRIKRSGSANVGRLREASRQKPPPEAKLAVVHIQADCLSANPPGCDANVALPSDVLNCVKRIKNRCASYRQHTLPHRRAASRSTQSFYI